MYSQSHKVTSAITHNYKSEGHLERSVHCPLCIESMNRNTPYECIVWRLTLLIGSILKYWARVIEPLALIWGNESTTPRQARVMGKHVNEGCFSYLDPQARGLIQETASLRLVIHPSKNLREGTTLPWVWDEVLAQRGMTNTRSSQGLQAKQGANLNSTNMQP